MDNKIFVVAKREYLERVRSKYFLVITLVVPVLLAGLVLFPTYLASRGSASSDIRHITIIDGTGTGLGDRIAKALMPDSVAQAGDTPAPHPERIGPCRKR